MNECFSVEPSGIKHLQRGNTCVSSLCSDLQMFFRNLDTLQDGSVRLISRAGQEENAQNRAMKNPVDYVYSG